MIIFPLAIDNSTNINYPDNDFSNHCRELYMVIGNRIVPFISEFVDAYTLANSVTLFSIKNPIGLLEPIEIAVDYVFLVFFLNAKNYNGFVSL